MTDTTSINILLQRGEKLLWKVKELLRGINESKNSSKKLAPLKPQDLALWVVWEAGMSLPLALGLIRLLALLMPHPHLQGRGSRLKGMAICPQSC